MNKEECLKALEKIKNDEYFITEDDEGDLIHIVNLYKKELKTLKCLIEEHFDNPPLKFEELEVGMWVWDNELRMYFQIKGKFNLTVGSYKVLEIIISNLSNGTWHYNTCHIYYQENRFYRKQV